MTPNENNQDYWSKRSLDRLVESELIGQEAIFKTQAIYDSVLKNLEKEFEALYRAYSKNGILDTNELKKAIGVAGKKEFLRKVKKSARILGLDPKEVYDDRYLSRMTRLEALKEQAQLEIMAIAPQEEKLTGDAYKEVLTQGYKSFQADVIQLGFAPTFATMDSGAVKRIASAKWAGSNYSPRIWGNTAALAKELPEIIGGTIAAGQSSQKSAQKLRERFGVSKYNATRLARTETNFFNGQSEIQSMIDDNIEKYEFDATIDGRTSKICRHLDGTIYNVKDAQPGVNLNPMHGQCRSRPKPYRGSVPAGGKSDRPKMKSPERFERFEEFETGEFKKQFYKTMQSGDTGLAVQQVLDYKKYGTLEKIPENMSPVKSIDELAERWGKLEIAKGSAGEGTILIKIQQGGDDALNAEAEWISQKIATMTPDKQQEALRRIDGIIFQMTDPGQKKQIELLKKYVGIPQTQTVATPKIDKMLSDIGVKSEEVTLPANQQEFLNKYSVKLNSIRSNTDDIMAYYDTATNSINLDVANLRESGAKFNNKNYIDKVLKHEIGHVIDSKAPQLRNDTLNFSDSQEFKDLLATDGGARIIKSRILDTIPDSKAVEELQKMKSTTMRDKILREGYLLANDEVIPIPSEIYSYYAQNDEMFAELYSIYSTNPEWLKKSLPKYYEYIQKVDEKL